MDDPAPSATSSASTSSTPTSTSSSTPSSSSSSSIEPRAGTEDVTLVDAPQSLKPREAPSTRPPSVIDSTGSSRGLTSRATSLVTPRETLHAQEIARTRVFVKLCFGLAVAVDLAMIVLPGDRIAKIPVLVGATMVMIATTWLGIVIRKDEGYTIERAVFVGAICILAAYAGIYFFGVNSPAPAVIPFGLCVFSSSLSNRGTLSVWLSCAVMQAALTFSVMTGLIVDRGLVRGEHLDVVEQIVILLLLEAIFAATFLIARASRNETLFAIEEHDRVLRAVSQREALLKEARQELRQALRGNGWGRWSEETIDAFRLGKVIGRGAMGEVYEARHVATNEEAAVKVLMEHVLAQPEHVERFFREARIVSSLNVPNVVKVVAVADRNAAVPYLAMERLHGTDLSDYLREHRRMSTAKVLTMIRQVGLGLEAARASGVVHRDLKPRNLFLARPASARAGSHGRTGIASTSPGASAHGSPEVWKILDFGVSKLTSEEATQTRSRMVGTPTYMAPEQISGQKVSHRTDLFALGVITYRALTGRPAWTGDQEAEILHKVLHSMPPAPSAVSSVPPEVDAVMAIALAKDVDERFDSAAELAQALEAATSGRLDASLAERARRILAKTPWGQA